LLTPANYWLGFDSLAQHHAITHEPDPAIHVAATFGIIDAIAVTDIEAALAAILPDRVLDERSQPVLQLKAKSSFNSLVVPLIATQRFFSSVSAQTSTA
jgi:hypothetical protein